MVPASFLLKNFFIYAAVPEHNATPSTFPRLAKRGWRIDQGALMIKKGWLLMWLQLANRASCNAWRPKVG